MKMNRKKFLGIATDTLAGSMLYGFAPCLMYDGNAKKNNATNDPLTASTFHAERRYIYTQFGEIAYAERGTGDDTALFLHAFLLNGFQWRGVLEPLSVHRRCIAPDFLGLGYSRVADGQKITPADQVEMLVAFMNKLNLSSADIVASDTGAGIAQLLAVRYPHRVRSLLLTNCDTEPDCPPASLLPIIEMARKEQFVPEMLAPWLADKDLARSPEAFGVTYTNPDKLDDETIEMYLAPLIEKPERTHAFTLALEPNWMAGIESSLKHCRAPARIVWGTGDTIFSADMPDYLDRTFGNSQGVRLLSGANLFWPEEFPDVIIEEARKLWATV